MDRWIRREVQPLNDFIEQGGHRPQRNAALQGQTLIQLPTHRIFLLSPCFFYQPSILWGVGTKKTKFETKQHLIKDVFFSQPCF